MRCDLAVQESTSHQALNYIYSQPLLESGVHLFVKETALCVSIPGSPSLSCEHKDFVPSTQLAMFVYL